MTVDAELLAVTGPDELFKKVVPHHYLGSLWSQLDKKSKDHLAPTVHATNTQFSSVANCFKDQSVTARARARARCAMGEHRVPLQNCGNSFFVVEDKGSFLPQASQLIPTKPSSFGLHCTSRGEHPPAQGPGTPGDAQTLAQMARPRRQGWVHHGTPTLCVCVISSLWL
uniref:Uncharacterized protein n=1 Tax=Molossus molossus TaxID=27622 RepID=A0A7J8GKT4_MOLMO|nr:hypothetical protein HJG59_011453 [Molossus molossus]